MFRRLLLLALLLQAATAAAQTAQLPPGAAIASAHPLATEAGFEVLNAGGNAFDAAVAVSAALAVVEPSGSGMGGGGFWLLHRASDDFQTMIDGREKAPLAASADMYQDAEGNVLPSASINGPLAAGIPGQAAALAHLAEQYGQLPLARSLAPAIRYARDGFRMDTKLFQLLTWRREAIKASPAAAEIFLRWGLPTPPGLTIKQPDLADTLQALADKGHAGFYSGAVAQRLVEGVRQAGGIWSVEDLAQYQVVERAPIRFKYRGYQITSAAPPSSGGVVLATALQILQGFDPKFMNSALREHLIVEAMRRAYRDRAEYLGDPDYVNMPLDRLTSPAYAQRLRLGIDLDKATPSSELGPEQAAVPQGTNTTHFSVIDAEGNRVAATLSINLPFGSGFVPPGTGVLLNNEMDDFVAKPGTPNSYGLVGNAANAIAPGKRMLSSMTPSFVESADRVAVLGTPGGSRIISMVMLGILSFVEGADAQTMVSLPRYHHQYLPDVVQHESDALSSHQRELLTQRGHLLQERSRDYGNMQVVIWDREKSLLQAAADPRGIGKGEVRLNPEAESLTTPAVNLRQ
ncbi:MAG: gamma-glutamyltransferase [Nevskiales bacterium]